MKPRTKSFWLLLVLALLTSSLLSEAKPNKGTFTLYKQIRMGLVTVEIFRGPKDLAVPDLCSGPVSANPTSGYTAFQVSSKATVTVSYNYEYCGGPNQPQCCTNTPPDCGNEFGWGTDPNPGITNQLGSWPDCDPGPVNQNSPLEINFCFQPNTTYYFKVYVTPTVYNCQNTYVTLSADCNYPSNRCP